MFFVCLPPRLRCHGLLDNAFDDAYMLDKVCNLQLLFEVSLGGEENSHPASPPADQHGAPFLKIQLVEIAAIPLYFAQVFRFFGPKVLRQLPPERHVLALSFQGLVATLVQSRHQERVQTVLIALIEDPNGAHIE